MDEETVRILIEQYIENNLEITTRDANPQEVSGCFDYSKYKVVELRLNGDVISSDILNLK